MTPPPLPPVPASTPLEPLAHVAPGGRFHGLEDHLTSVAMMARAFAARFEAGDWAHLAGLWHDLGKYAANFQKMILEANGIEAHIEGDTSGPRDHSTAGAIHARQTLGPTAMPIAFAIAGHHAGLADCQDLLGRLASKEKRYQAALERKPPAAILKPEGLTLPAQPACAQDPVEGHLRVEMWVRMLFSALCDADFLDTERFFDATKTELRGGYPPLETLRSALRAHLDGLGQKSPALEVNRVRAEVRAACEEAASTPPGVFSLTVPTGGGKTLASLAFALAHAEHHGLERVVVAIPYTSIIEQSAEAYRRAFGDHPGAVIEHHSAIDAAKETAQNRISSENWDAPLVVTTTVQLFESLFANRPGACRKLHRLARSVIVLDEAQTLPPELLTPILSALRELVASYGSSIVICTATQPALGREQGRPEGFERVHEIVPPALRLFERLRRVRARWPVDDEPTAYPELARQVASERDVLAIVHRRADARALCEAVDGCLGDETTVHLSALMCAEHRSHVLAGIARAKKAGEPVRVVSTQLVEAGVDLDFAVVYRALGGIDAMAQAAGRCNREGRLEGLGELRLFHAPTTPPPGVARAALAVTRDLLRGRPDLDLFDPETYRTYFKLLYGTRNLDEKKIQELRRGLNFRTVASTFRLIDDDWSAPVIVPYGDAGARLAELAARGPSRERLRALQRFTVTVPKRARDAWVRGGLAREVAETVTALPEVAKGAYSKRFGLVLEQVGFVEPDMLIA